MQNKWLSKTEETLKKSRLESYFEVIFHILSHM